MAFWDDFKKNVFKAVDDLTWWDNQPQKTTQAAPQQPVVAAPQKPVTIVKPSPLTSPLEMPGTRNLLNTNMQPNTTPQTLLAKPTSGTVQDKVRLVSTQPTASPTVDANKLNELKTKAQTYQNAGVQDVNNYYGTDLKGLNEAIARGDTKQAEGLMRSLDNRRTELKKFHDERGKSQTFKSARDLEQTIKDTRGDWTNEKDQLTKFWGTVKQNELNDFQDYLAAKTGKPLPQRQPQPGQPANINSMLLTPDAQKNAWKWGGTFGQGVLNKGADFSPSVGKIKEVQTRQRGIDTIIKDYGDYKVSVDGDNIKDQTVGGFIDNFKKLDAGKQRDVVKKLEGTTQDLEQALTPEQTSRRDQAAILLEMIKDRGDQKHDLGTNAGDAGDFVVNMGKGLISPFQKLDQVGQVYTSGQIFGINNPTTDEKTKGVIDDAYNKASAAHNEGKIPDDQFNKMQDEYVKYTSQYMRDHGWVGQKDKGLWDRVLKSAAVSADVTSSVIPFLSATKGFTAVKAAQAGGEGTLKSALGKELLEQTVANATANGVSAFREGVDTKPGDVLNETLIGAGTGAGSTLIGAGIKGGKDQIVKMLAKGTDDVPTEAITKNAFTPQEAVTAQKRLSDAGVKTFAPLQDDAAVKVTKLMDDANAVPVPEGSTRLYQTNDLNGTPSPNYFNDPKQLANWINGRSENSTLRYVDVPTSQVAEIGSKSGVFEIKSPETPNAVKIQQGKAQSIADLLPDFKARAEQAKSIDPIAEQATKYGVAPETIEKMNARWGEQKTANILARSSDASNIRDMDAFVYSEAKKAYGNGNVAIKSDTPVENPTQAIPEEATVKVTRPTQEQVQAPKEALTDVPETPLGNMADDFYQSKTGNQRIKYRDLENLGKNIAKQIDADFKAINSDYATVARKVQEAARNGVKTLEEAGLNPAEAAILRKAQAEMNYVRRRASLGKREVTGGNFDEMYLPQQKTGAYEGDQLFEGFRAEKPGNEFKRGNKIELEDLDYSPDVIGQYVTRYGDTKLLSQERIYRALAKHNEGVEESLVRKAADQMIAIQDKVNSIKTKISAFGAGTRKQLDESGKFVDSAKEMTEVGRTLGHDMETLTDEGHGLTNGDRINSVMTGEETLGDRLGLNQWRDAKNYASSQVQAANGDHAALAESVRNRLTNDYNLTPEDIEYAVGGISRMSPNLPEEVVLSRVQSTYKNAAKQQLLEELQHLDITNPKLRKDVSGLTNQVLREGSIQTELSEKITRGILRTQNALFRKLNVSSALNELSDLNSFLSVYGRKTALKPDFGTIKEFGLGDIDAAIEPYVRQLEGGAKVADVLKSINSKTNLYKFVEHYKAAVVGTSAKNSYIAKGLTGDELTKAVLDDYRTLALPVDAFTKTFLDNAPLYTQYMTWGVRNLQKELKLATGKIDAGKLGDMTTGQRIARNAYANLPAKTVFWLTSNGLKGTGILTAFGLTDFTGMSSGDYSGIQDEDKSLFDKTTQFTNQSTTLSLLNTIIQSWEKEQLKNSDKYKDADYNPYANNALDEDIINNYTPQFIKNIVGATDMNTKGYSDNNDNFAREVKDSLGITQDNGRVQYEAPTDFYNIAKSYLFGKSQTDNAREYSGNKNLAQRLGEGTDIVTAITDMAKEQVNAQDKNYTRPLTEDYSTAYKAAVDGGRTALLQGGRQYNKYLDDLRKNSPDLYENYIASMDGNHVTPEQWREKAPVGPDGKIDLTTFKMLADRKKQLAKPQSEGGLGKAYDPLYDLPDDQARSVLQLKSTPTGDDIALRTALKKEQWYNDLTTKQKAFYAANPPEGGDFDETERVKTWSALDDAYNSTFSTTNEDGSPAEWTTRYPLVAQQKSLEYGSPESKAWFSANYDAWKAQSDAYKTEQLALINKMREIEGYPPMSAEQYAQATTFTDTDGDSSSSRKSGGYSKSSDSGKRSIDYGNARSVKINRIQVKTPTVKVVKKATGGGVKIKRGKSKA